MIEVQNLTKHYDGRPVLRNVSFSVQRGEILGLLGVNGAGKSTTMNIITGYLSGDEGTVLVDGHDVLEEPRAVKAAIGYLPEQPPLYPDMTVREQLSFAYELRGLHLKKEAHLAEICRQTGIEEVQDRLIKHLSRGYRQRVGLAQALLGDPPVLILDEPTAGLDPKQITEIRSLIRSLGKEHTIIFSSHILPEVQAVCDRIVVLSHGEVAADDTPLGLESSRQGDAALLLEAEGEPGEITQLLWDIPGTEKVENLGLTESGVWKFRYTAGRGLDRRREVFRTMAEADLPLLSLTRDTVTLEDVFLELTRTEAEEGEDSHDSSL